MKAFSYIIIQVRHSGNITVIRCHFLIHVHFQICPSIPVTSLVFLIYFSSLGYNLGSHMSCLFNLLWSGTVSRPCLSFMRLTFLKVQDSGFPECATIWIVRLSFNILSINTTQMKCVLLGASAIMCSSLRTFSPCILHTNSAITHPQTLSRGGGGGLLSPAAANTAHLHRTFSLFFACYPRVPLFTAQLKYHTYHKNCLY